MPIENEIKREMVQLLLSSSQFNFQKTKDLTECAQLFTDFILEKNQTEEPCDI